MASKPKDGEGQASPLLIVQRKISELVEAEYNPRQITEKQFRQLKDSLQRFGFVDPVLVNMHPERKNIIIGGHMRTRAWESLGHDTVPTVELDLTPERERELNIRLNKSGGSWDMDALANYFDTDDLIGWGFEVSDFPTTADEDTDREDMSDQIGASYRIEVSCADEAQQQELFERLQAEGFEVKILNL